MGSTGRRLLLAFGSMVGLLQAYALPGRWNRGPEGHWWEPVRRRLSGLLGRFFDRRAGPRPITVGEYAGWLDCSVDQAERLLWQWGFIRNPFARVKTLDGVAEAGSWVYRDRALAGRQLHVMLFARHDGRTDVYAHEEPSSVNPRFSRRHFAGEDQRLATGVKLARERLPLDTTDAPIDPPDGPWTESVPAARVAGPLPGHGVRKR
ncbi:hypothetical protein BRD19_01345 [Halobacteriales archaeon SW_7_65_23]|nr:MAG: hypothetical protein BRD19_01345 [Halobacteriales archaeon SW_7_65_23]